MKHLWIEVETYDGVIESFEYVAIAIEDQESPIKAIDHALRYYFQPEDDSGADFVPGGKDKNSDWYYFPELGEHGVCCTSWQYIEPEHLPVLQQYVNRELSRMERKTRNAKR